MYWVGTREDMVARMERAKSGRRGRHHRHPDWSFSHGRDWGSPSIPEQMNFKTMLRFAPEGLARPRWLQEFRRTKIPDLTVPNMVQPGRAGADLLRRLRRVDADAPAELGRRRVAARAVGRPVHAQGRHPSRRREAGRRRRRQRRSRSPTTAATTSTARRPRSGCCRQSPKRSATRSRCCSTAASAAAATS